MVQKRDGIVRMCVDYRVLNSATAKDCILFSVDWHTGAYSKLTQSKIEKVSHFIESEIHGENSDLRRIDGRRLAGPHGDLQ